jgi:hypothetical protein
MIVWRVEDRKGEGPYGDFRDSRRQKLQEALVLCHGYSTDHPSPLDDELGEYLSANKFKPVFGFKSKEDAIKWFAGFWQDLHKLGFRLKTFEAKDYLVGKSNKQLVFIKE